MDFEKKGMISTKYLADGCEFKKVKNSYKLISTTNFKYEPFVGKTFSENAWDLVSASNVTSGDKYNELYGLLLNHFESGNTIFNKDANILLKKGEFVVYQSLNNIILKEPKSIRVTNSVHAGSGHRSGNRSLGYGVSRSVGETQEVVKIVDTGQFIITNKRFIYSGINRNIDVNISQIVGITPYTDGFKLQRKGKKKPEYFTNVDSFVFTYNFGNDTYFFTMNGQIIKSLIQGGLNKTPQKSKLQLLSSQRQISTKKQVIKLECDDFNLEYNNSWSKIANKKDNDILTIEQINPPYRAEIRISKSANTNKSQNLEISVKNLFKQNDFKITEFNNISVDETEMLSAFAIKDIGNKTLEFAVTIFYINGNQYSIYLTNNELNIIAKDEYIKIIKSINVNNTVINNNDKVNFCPNCGIQIEHEGNFCQNCGFKLN